MTITELSSALSNMYTGASKGEQSAMIRLFGIKYANEMKQNGYTPKDILKNANMPESYHAEISKGIKLSKYVEVKAMYR